MGALLNMNTSSKYKAGLILGVSIAAANRITFFLMATQRKQKLGILSKAVEQAAYSLESELPEASEGTPFWSAQKSSPGLVIPPWVLSLAKRIGRPR